jgi:hypothetical protein
VTEIERYELNGAHLEQKTDSWVLVLTQVADLANKIGDTSFVPDGFRGNVPAVAATILYGREVGLGPMQALASLHSIKGRVAMSAEAMRAKALEAGHDLVVVDSTSAKCTVKGRRRGSEDWTPITWTIDDAKRAGLRGDNWAHYPRQMLQARATAELCRLIFPDAIHGLPAVEELEQEGTAAITAAATTKVQRLRAEPPPPPLEAAVSHPAPQAATDTDQPEIVAENPVQPPPAAPEPAGHSSPGPVGADEADHAAPSTTGEATSGDVASPATRRRRVDTVKPLDDYATRTQLNQLRALLRAHNGTLTTLVVPIIGHPIHAASELTEAEAELVIGELQAQLDRAKEAEPDPDLLDVDDE